MLFCGFLSGPGLNQVTSTFWSVTQSLHGGEQATIPHMEEDSQSFHMIPNAQIFISEITLIRANYTFICVAPRINSLNAKLQEGYDKHLVYWFE